MCVDFLSGISARGIYVAFALSTRSAAIASDNSVAILAHILNICDLPYIYIQYTIGIQRQIVEHWLAVWYVHMFAARRARLTLLMGPKHLENRITVCRALYDVEHLLTLYSAVITLSLSLWFGALFIFHLLTLLLIVGF